MSERLDAGTTDALPVGRVKAVTAGERRIAVYHTPDGFFATDDTCPHRGAPLHEGDLAGNEITCGWHLWAFDVRNGVCTGNSEVSVTTHEVAVEEGRIVVRLS